MTANVLTEVVFYPVFIVAVPLEVIDIIAEACFDLAFTGLAEMFPTASDYIFLCLFYTGKATDV